MQSLLLNKNEIKIIMLTREVRKLAKKLDKARGKSFNKLSNDLLGSMVDTDYFEQIEAKIAKRMEKISNLANPD